MHIQTKLTAIVAFVLASTTVNAPVFASTAPQLAGRVAASTPVSFALMLPLRDAQGLDAFLDRLADPHSPDYRKYLTPSEFAARFGPTEADYAALQLTAQQAGLTIKQTYAARTVLDVDGPASAVEPLLRVRLNTYIDASGRSFHAADADPKLSGTLASLGASVIGLDNRQALRPHLDIAQTLTPGASPVPVGMSPAQIKKAYDMPALDGVGQTLALMELDGYTASDVQTYKNQWGIVGTPVQNILVDTATGAAGTNALEVVLDIDMVLALAQNAASLRVYEAPNTTQGAIDCYSRIANDNLAKSVSTSWGLAEAESTRTDINHEATIFAQMAAQGQSIFASTGDTGAYDNPNTPAILAVDDPASQPNVTGVGGTSLTVNFFGNYVSETSWNSSIGSGGGGVSDVWPIPTYQSNAGLSGASRLVPDVSINADPNKGYAVYFTDPSTGAGWVKAAGTSAGAPLWAGYTAIINQQLGTAGPLGMANNALYRVASTPTRYTRDFHDIADGSNNKFYTAKEGHDEVTGLGSLDGSTLLADITTPTPTGSGTAHTFASGLQFFSVPLEYVGNAVSTVFSQPVTLAYWNPTSSSYIISPNAPVNTVHQMIGYWARFPSATNILNNGIDVTTGQTSISIELKPGWNMIGNPYASTVPLSHVTITSLTNNTAMSLAQANAAGFVYQTIYSYDPSTNQYVTHISDSLTPYLGYWIKVFQPCKITVTP